MTSTQQSEQHLAGGLPADLDEAVHRCLVAGFDGTTGVPHTLKGLIDRGLGGVILFTRNVRDAGQVRRLTDELRALRPDLLVAIDNEGGGIGHLVAAGAPEVPGSYALGVVDDPDLTARCADALAGHLASLGITVSYAPVADLQHHPDNPIVRTRSFGADPELAARHLRAWITATEARGVASCAKHFPGHGGTVTDSHHEMAVDPRSYDEILADVEPFRAAVAAGVPMLMSAHVVYPALDPERPATLSRRILGDLLRHELGFEGVLVSDALEMKAIADRYGEAAGARLALAAGADQVIVAVPDLSTTLACRDAVIDALREGVLAEERVREAAGRVRGLAERYASGGVGGGGVGASVGVGGWDAEAGLEAARRAVRGGFAGVARSGGVAGSGGSPGSGGVVGSAGSQGSAVVARSGGVVGSGGSQGSAVVAWSGGAVGSAGSPGSAEVAGVAGVVRSGAGVGVRGAYVVDLFPSPHPALNWGGEDLLSAVRALDPTAAGVALNEAPVEPGALVEGILRRAAGAPLVVATADAGLYPWQGELRERLVAGRGDAVVVETGLPGGGGHGGAAAGALCSFGRGRVNLRALAEVLVGGV
ncbi:glycoside hydrolase family 3 N-terminal domain-containing protein [Streptomyces sp. ME02-8801-2C]|uniref:glycoside hydrolase family 3 N-terminal domain-containing protein n=1 Tax=Streptomyces sp. ME02-8801-2C TaxID=3028680 RepID=UPI0029AD5ACE|nr:glycoside hydrolase family 3 N-terminal domain-containing protein [Streptomyces sp. ME02-8801-2C]MDX3457449.1 glycoside hydrolase family 3 N-terminal domain-containing protein [Streptomyces sp. ME02-8801-2C]